MLYLIQSEGCNKFWMFLSSFCHLDSISRHSQVLLVYYFIAEMLSTAQAALKSNKFDLEWGHEAVDKPDWYKLQNTVSNYIITPILAS